MRVAVLLAAAVLPACGSERATSPTPPRPSPSPRGLAAGAVVSLVRGDTGAPVAGAQMTVAGRIYQADAEGRVRVDDAAEPGALIDVVAPSVLDRQTLVRSEPLGTLVLWPRTSAAGIDEAFTTAVVYTSATVTDAGAPGQAPLRRFPILVAQVAVVPTAEILGDPHAHAAVIEGVARLNRAARGAITFALSPIAPASGPAIAYRVGPADPSCGDRVLAFARLTTRAGEIVSGEIVFCRPETAHDTRVAVHELGHGFGLNHSEDPRDMMFGTFIAAHAADFRPREVEIMSLVMQRRPGNRFPDSDRDLPASNALDTTLVVCR